MFFSVDIQYECTLNHDNRGVSLFSFSNQALQVVPRVILVCAAWMQLYIKSHNEIVTKRLVKKRFRHKIEVLQNVKVPERHHKTGNQ
jgi:hypothetical protein